MLSIVDSLASRCHIGAAVYFFPSLGVRLDSPGAGRLPAPITLLWLGMPGLGWEVPGSLARWVVRLAWGLVWEAGTWWDMGVCWNVSEGRGGDGGALILGSPMGGWGSFRLTGL